MTSERRSNRKEEILGALAHMLETSLGKPITTARLAAEVGVSEAALYRHFPSKAKMFSDLIDLIDETLFASFNRLLEQEKDTFLRIRGMQSIIFSFVEQSPGVSRVLTGEALMGEHTRLTEQVAQLFNKLESLLKQVLRERKIRENQAFEVDESILANVVMAYTEGKLLQFVRSGFKAKPSAQFESQWTVIKQQLLGA